MIMDSEMFKDAPSGNIPDLSGIAIDGGRLRLINVVGRGAWGVVYRGEDTANPGEYYAVKCMAIAMMTRDQQRSVEKEVSMHTICANSTPNVVQLLNVIEDDDSGMLFIVTEFCDGGDLLDRILDQKYIGNDELIRNTYIQILDAVEACHTNGVYHRDLKPENILVKDEGRTIIVGDFGFATTKKITTDFRMGSEPFMSPELRGGVHISMKRLSSPQTDIWALGVILMNLITGCLPWGKASTRDPHFVSYVLHDRDYLYHTFPISRGANEILKSIFTLDPRKRTSIRDLRRRVLELNTFGPGRLQKPKLVADTERYVQEDVAVNSDSNSDTLSDGNVDEQLEAATLHIVNGPISEADITDAPLTRDIVGAFPVPPADLQAPQNAASTSGEEECSLDVPINIEVNPPGPVSEADIADQIYQLDSDSDSDCDNSDSDGPITPETHAVDEPAVVGTGEAASLENINELTELDLGDAGPSSVIKAAVVAVAQAEAVAKGKNGLIEPVPLRLWNNDGAAFAPPEQAKTVGKAYEGAKSHPSTKRMLWSAVRIIGVSARRKVH